jgi:hypothetical protein
MQKHVSYASFFLPSLFPFVDLFLTTPSRSTTKLPSLGALGLLFVNLFLTIHSRETSPQDYFFLVS